jgi:hypothetical protein
MVAYFPEEQVIRILGHNCFGSINSDKHNEAILKYREDIRRAQDQNYLLNNLGLVPELLKIVADAVPVGYAVDDLRNSAVQIFKEALKTDLYSHIRTGSLLITTVRKQHSNLPGREGEEREVRLTESYGRIAGQDMLKASYPRLGRRLEQAQLALQQIDYGVSFKDRLATMDDADRKQAARLLFRSLTSIQDTFKRIQDLRQFTSPTTIATLNGWARHPDAPLQMRVSYDGPSLQVGTKEFEVRRIIVPPAYQTTLKALPSIAMTLRAATGTT